MTNKWAEAVDTSTNKDNDNSNKSLLEIYNILVI